ncbi:hypothetical protein BH24PSE2_BH24PSE2_02790 [soil metagenome]
MCLLVESETSGQRNTIRETFHSLHRCARSERLAGPGDRAHGSVGYAILYTTLIVTPGFSLRAFSPVLYAPSALKWCSSIGW